MKIKRIDELFDWTSNGGIFYLLNNYDVPWKDAIDAELLDFDYYGNRSGGKACSPLLSKLLEEDETLSAANKQKIASLIFSKYSYSWQQEWDAFMKEYNPLDNYSRTRTTTTTEDRTEERTPNLQKETKNTGTQNIDNSKTGTISRDNDELDERNYNETGTETTSNSDNTNVDDKIFGFNSTTASNQSSTSENSTNSSTRTPNLTNSETSSRTGNETVTNDLKETTERTDDLTSIEKETGSDTHKTDGIVTVESKTEGNVGTATYQDMLESELVLRSTWQLFDNIIFKDVDNILTVNIFLD